MRFVLISILFINNLLACSVCYGAPDEPAVKAAQAGILFLLGVVGFVLSGFAIFMYNLSRKEQKV
tara:strand:- start:368 stop:562 length:195 start_codon:yes stop_codon:yes gene_type:complete